MPVTFSETQQRRRHPKREDRWQSAGKIKRPQQPRVTASEALQARPMSAAEEQPQQNNHRYRHADQPEQKSSSHDLLHAFLCRENVTEKHTFRP